MPAPNAKRAATAPAARPVQALHYATLASTFRPMNVCSICTAPARPEIDAALSAADPVRHVAARFGVSLPALYRHQRAGHFQAAALAPQAPNATPSNTTLAPAISATLRDVQRLAREAQRHLKDARKAGDHKATNGAITAAAKALELVGKLRGELQSGAQVNVGISVEAKVAMDLRSHADSLSAADVTREARDWLAAQLEAGDADARAVVGELMRLLPYADGGQVDAERIDTGPAPAA